MGQRLDNVTGLYLEGIRDGNFVTAINSYAGQRYTQHSTPVRDGREGFIEFFEDFTTRNPIRDIEIVRGFEDGHFVFIQARQKLNNGEFTYVTADIFDTDDDAKLIEHWDMIAEVEPTSVSGRTPFDGPTEVTDLDKTEVNKRLVFEYVTKVLVEGDGTLAASFVHPDLAQHDSLIADGRDAYFAFADAHAVRYQQIHNLIGSGNFVAVLAAAHKDGIAQALIDLYRVENGLIVEHWVVSEEITDPSTWVNSGKF
ncbi:nuclear transport factor 2 family protein [Salinibacterium sp. SWN248]|uniref:nuclear transport factor 2 family protein n=1 Tax=Salinibacterium sp. SWN248 TaxID=2792056 RepID=UPI0018CDB5B0|nr:nuclear transport factor 2 family protein [Salinibacterium sp. SWN248]MBH0023324.1 nuclear transport factor 2 family protein [Salinibacterium sp. SWN248]